MLNPFKKFYRAKLLVGLLMAMVAISCSSSQTNNESGVEALLLKNYRPQSIYTVSGGEVSRAMYPVIDMHSHNKYVRSVDEIEQWVQNMEDVGIERAILLTTETGAAFDSLYALYTNWEDRFELWGGLDYTGYDTGEDFPERAIRELERMHKMGIRGIGELGDKGAGLSYSKPTQAVGMHIDDPRMDPILEKAGELGMPINIHVAEPKWMYEKMDSTNDGLMNAYKWRLDNKEGIKNHAQMLQTLENAVKKHPNTTFIAAHMANSAYDLSIMDRMLSTYPNLYADIGARYAELAQIPRHVANLIEKHQNNIFYGTDMGFQSSMYRTTFKILETRDEHFYRSELFGYHWSLSGFNLNDEVLEKIYRKNAIELLGD